MAYISSAEVAEIRKDLKITFPGWKFSVRKDGNSSVCVTVLKGKHEFKCNLAKYGTYEVNQYCIDTIKFDHEEERVAIKKMLDIIKTSPAKAENGSEWYDSSNASVDYFNTAFFFHLAIGDSKKKYEVM